MIIPITGYLDFDINDVTKKHHSQSSWKRTAMIRTNCDLDQYYTWFLVKRFGLDFNKNLRGSHVTIISDRMDNEIFKQGSEIFNGKPCEFFIDPEPRSNGLHWWLRVYSPMAESIRISLGLSPDPYFAFHLTLGHIKERPDCKEHSEYILRCCKKFELISNEPKLPFLDQKVYNF